MRRIISILLQNEAGALARVAGMFSARGYNIDSLTVAATLDPTVSRLTLVTFCSEAVMDQIIKQSRKIIDVLEIADLTGRQHLESELLIVKLHIEPGADSALAGCIASNTRALVVDETQNTRTLQFTGTGTQVNAFLAELSAAAPVLEMARSGIAALDRGEVVVASPQRAAPMQQASA